MRARRGRDRPRAAPAALPAGRARLPLTPAAEAVLTGPGGEALDALERVLPRACRVELRGVGHLAADNGGRPELVARALAGFFRGGG
ncbi:hypothetical protein GCM10009551_038780 [Nocardiopsis tropica]